MTSGSGKPVFIHGLFVGDEEFPLDGLESVREAIEQVSEAGITAELRIEDEEWYMDILGTELGLFAVSVYAKRERHHLCDLSVPYENDVEINIGGQLSRVSKRYLVPIETALAAARAFALTGRMDASLTWERR